MDIFEKLELYEKRKEIPAKYVPMLRRFYLECYKMLKDNALERPETKGLVEQHLELVKNECVKKTPFSNFHKAKREGFDLYKFGLDFTRPMINFLESSLSGKKAVRKIFEGLKAKKNVVVFANHQTEIDPQVFSLLLEREYPSLAEDVIFVAGNRVTTDPAAIPLSLGRNLLCIFSKKYIEHPPEEKHQKQMYNRRTMSVMKDLLAQGGKFIVVFPSGGRDRKNDKGKVEVSKFDSSSVAMFKLISKQAKVETQFYPATFVTYDVMPPPEKINRELGEVRIVRRAPVHLHFGQEIDMNFYKDSHLSKHDQRDALAEMIWKEVKKEHDNLVKE